MRMPDALRGAYTRIGSWVGVLAGAPEVSSPPQRRRDRVVAKAPASAAALVLDHVLRAPCPDLPPPPPSLFGEPAGSVRPPAARRLREVAERIGGGDVPDEVRDMVRLALSLAEEGERARLHIVKRGSA